MFIVIRQFSRPLSNRNMSSGIAIMIALYDEKLRGSCLSLGVLALA